MRDIGTELQTSGESEQRIGRSLIGLVLVAVLPLLVFGSGAAWMVFDQKKEAIARELANTTQALQVAVDRELLGQLELMQILATDASLDQGNLAAFNDRARRAVQTHSEWRKAVLVDTKTHLIVASSLPMPPPGTETSWPTEVDAVSKTRASQIAGVMSVGKIVTEPSIYFLVPVLRNGEVPWVMVVPMDTNPLNGIFAAQRLSSSWTGAVLDKNLNIAGRSRDPERFVGKRATPTLADQILASEHGMFTALNQEGQTVYTVYSRSAFTGWSVALGVPAAEVEGPIQRIVLLWAGAGSVLIALALMMTARVGRGILRSRNAYEVALRDSRASAQAALGDFNDLVRRLPVGVYRYRMLAAGGHRFDFVSERMCRQVGATQADIMRDPELAFGCFSPQDLGELIRTNEAARETLQAFCWEGRVDLPDGQHWLRMESIPTKLPNGDILWNGTQQDISERRRSEESIRQLSAAVEQSPATVVITDVDASIVYANPRFTQVTGYSLTEAIGQNPRMLQSKLTSPNTYVELWAKLTNGLAWQGELVNQRKNGEQYWEEAHIAPIKDAHGATTHYVAVKVDITDRKIAEVALKNSEAQFRAFFDKNLAIMLAIRPGDGQIVDANQAATAYYGYDHVALCNLHIYDLNILSPEECAREMADATNERRNFFNFRHRKADGTIRDVEVYSTPIRLNVATTLFAIIHDVTERNQIAAALQESEARYARVVDGTDEGYWEWNLVTQAVAVSVKFEAMLGYAPGEWVLSHENWLRHVHPDDVEPSMRLFEKHLQGESPQYSNAFRMKTKLGQWLWIRSKGKVASRDADGKALLVAGTHTDISRQRKAEEDLTAMNKDFVTLLESSSDFLYFKDSDNRIRYCSQTMADISGYKSWQDLVGKNERDLFPPENADIYLSGETQVFSKGIPLLNKIEPYNKPDGSSGWVSTNKWPMFADDGKTVVGLFGISRDVTDAKRHEQELLVMATTDYLTGVESRRNFVGAVDYEIARMQRDSSCQCAILMFDLDHFKKVNDTYGHATGDEVLKHITKIMGSEIRKVDRIGRLGGEEFAILMPGADMTSAQTFAERLRQEVETTPISVDGQSIVVTVSIGLSDLKGSDESSGPAIKRVDQALYKAKSHGRNRVEVLT